MTGKVKNKKSVVESLGGSNLLEDFKTGRSLGINNAQEDCVANNL